MTDMTEYVSGINLQSILQEKINSKLKIRRFTESFKLAYSKTAGARYFMNHCQHCGAKLGDFFMHSEPGGAFFPTSPAQANKMTLFRINERFDANCGLGYASDDFMEYMQIVDK